MTFAITVHKALGAVSSEWPRGGQAGEVEASAHHVFQTVTFLKVWNDSFNSAGRVAFRLVEVRDEAGRPVLFLPLALVSRSGVTCMTFIDGDAADYNAPILFPVDFVWTKDLAERLWSEIVAVLPRFDVLELTKMPREIDGVANPLALLAHGSNDVMCHGQDLKRPWADIDRSLSRRKTLMKRKRALERLVPCRMVVARTEDERAAIMTALLRQKQRRFEETMVPGFAEDPAKLAFFRDGSTAFAKADMLLLTALMAGDEIVSTLWGLTRGRHYYALMIGFEAGEWASYSVGRLICLHTMEHLHAGGFEYFDLGVGDETWKLEQRDTTIALFCRTEAMTGKGRLYLDMTAWLKAARQTRIWQRARPLKWVIMRRLRKSGEGIRP